MIKNLILILISKSILLTKMVKDYDEAERKILVEDFREFLEETLLNDKIKLAFSMVVYSFHIVVLTLFWRALEFIILGKLNPNEIDSIITIVVCLYTTYLEIEGE